MPKVTITQAYFSFYDADGRYVVAQRGEEVDVPTGAEFDRGERAGAWDPANLPQEVGAVVPGYIATTDANGTPLVGDDLEEILKGNTHEILAYAEAHPEARADLLAREIGTDKPRKGIVSGLEKLGNSPAPTTPQVSPDPIVAPVVSILDNDSEAEILAYAEDHKDEVLLLIETEEAGRKRESLIEGLNKLKA